MKVVAQPKATKGWWWQFGIAVVMTLCTACFWYAVAPYSSQCGSYNVSPQLLYCIPTFIIGFISVLTIWVVGICVLCSFPNQEDTEDLIHSTPSWTAIKQSGCVLPTADGRIYFLDRDEKLGQKSVDGTDTKLIFSAAKNEDIAKKAQFGPLMFLRFKTGRGEWLAEPGHYLTIDEFHESKDCKQVIISRYALKKAKGNMWWWLQFRRWTALVFISPVFVAFLVGALIFEKAFARRFNWYDMWTVWGIVIVVSFVVIWYFFQGKFNKMLFKRGRPQASLDTKISEQVDPP